MNIAGSGMERPHPWRQTRQTRQTQQMRLLSRCRHRSAGTKKIHEVCFSAENDSVHWRQRVLQGGRQTFPKGGTTGGNSAECDNAFHQRLERS